MKSNWLCLLMFLFILVIVGVYIYRISKYNERIDKRDDKIKELTIDKDSIQIKLDALDDEYKSLTKVIELYSDSISYYEKERIAMRRRYEKQISDITAIPVDSVYSEVTRWLDER